MIRFLRFTCLLLLAAFGKSALANNISSVGVPYIQNYTKAMYGSGNQNWSVTKDRNGIMYFGNAGGLLSFDGKYWQLYEMPNRQIVRAVVSDQSGRIYTGGFAEFGFWDFKNNRLNYNSLTHLLPRNHKLDDEIWKIYVAGSKVIFQSFSTIYIYEKGKVSFLKTNATYLFLHQVGNRFFIESLGKGLFELVGTKLNYVPNSLESGVGNVLSILSYKDGKMLIGTSKNGLLLYDGSTFKPFATAANPYLKTYHLNNGVRLLDKYYAYGTILNGLIIIDSDGNIVQTINKSTGLQNNTVLSLFVDDQQNLWAGLDNGIDRVELNSPLHFYFDKAGQFGTVYSSLIYKDKIYLGTNQGLFYSSWPGNGASRLNTFNFTLIPNSQGQVWDLTQVGGQLLCGHNEGTFNVTGGTMQRISAINGGWTIKALNSNPDLLVQGTYTGLAIYTRVNGQWALKNQIDGFVAPSRYVEQDVNGDIWVSHAYRGLYRLTLSADYKKVVKSRYLDEKDGLPNAYNLNIFKLENKIVFSSEKGFYIYDEMAGKFVPYTGLNNKLGSFSTANKIINAGGRKYWFINHGKAALADFSDPAKAAVDSNRFSILDGRMVQYYENISQINEGIYLISVDDGFVIYYTQDLQPSDRSMKLPGVLIRKIEDITDNVVTLSEFGTHDNDVALSYSRNNIRIAFSLPYFRQAKVRYQYYLDGYSRQWSEWDAATQKDFTNLASGTYHFRVRAMVNNVVGPETVFDFTVLTPWYASIVAKLIYVLITIWLLSRARRIYEQKLKRDGDRIQERLQKEQEMLLKTEAEQSEKQIIKLQTEKLHAELAAKSRELSNSALSLVSKNELLQNLSNEIASLKDEHGHKLPEDQVRKIQKVISDGLNDESDWDLFENSFNEAHESFFRKLKRNHPTLVPNDLKLCAYLRMNMNSKEIASLLNITLRGVEIRRYRLRKKLGVAHDKNLSEFLMEV